MPRAKQRCPQRGCKLYKPCKTHKVWKQSSGHRDLPSNWSSLKKKAKNFGTKICYLCRTRDPGGQVDHIINRAAGGTDTPSNLAWICRRCHDLKTEAEKQAGRKRAQKKGHRRTGGP